jgi:hypothetical protein
MGELLPDFDRKFEIGGCSFGPTLGSFGITRPVKGGVDLNGVEVPRIKSQFVRLQKRIKETCPGARPRTRRITPSACTDAENACVVLRLLKEVRRCWVSLRRSLPGFEGFNRSRLLRLVQDHQCDERQAHQGISDNYKKSEIIHFQKTFLILRLVSRYRGHAPRAPLGN